MIGRAFDPREGDIVGAADRNLGPEVANQKVQDPWAQRTKGMKCMTCIWFVPKERITLGAGSVGRCRRHAPTMNGYPVVYMTDWCGDHRVDENRV